MKTIFRTILILSLLIFAACDKPNPEPEKLDPIYADIQARLASVNSAIKSAEKDLEDKKKEAALAVPQTGQIKFGQKRVYEAENVLAKLNQQKTYWELKVLSRKNWAREHYLKAYEKKELWPDPKENEEYRAQKKLEEAPKDWNAKQRLKDYTTPPAVPKPAGGGKH